MRTVDDGVGRVDFELEFRRVLLNEIDDPHMGAVRQPELMPHLSGTAVVLRWWTVITGGQYLTGSRHSLP